MTTPQELKTIISEGLLSFPVTDFDAYLAIRNRRAGYAVSIVKAGAKLVGHSAGPVRAPFTDLTDDEVAQLDVPIRKLGAQ